MSTSGIHIYPVLKPTITLANDFTQYVECALTICNIVLHYHKHAFYYSVELVDREGTFHPFSSFCSHHLNISILLFTHNPLTLIPSLYTTSPSLSLRCHFSEPQSNHQADNMTNFTCLENITQYCQDSQWLFQHWRLEICTKLKGPGMCICVMKSCSIWYLWPRTTCSWGQKVQNSIKREWDWWTI